MTYLQRAKWLRLVVMCTNPAHMDGNCGYLVSWSETDTEPFSSMVERSHVTTKDAGSTPVMVPNEKKACSQKIQ